MDDFASASMLRLLLRAMALEGLPPVLPLPDAARVPLQHKQKLVSFIVDAGGLPLLLKLAQQVQHIDGEPLHRVLVSARDPHDFLARWQRLERYVHAKHRIVSRESGPRTLVLEHTAPGSAAPMAAESVAVLGVWIGALQAIGTHGLNVQAGRHLVHGNGAQMPWHPSTDSPLTCWHLKWAPGGDAASSDRAGRTPMPKLSSAVPPWPSPASELAHWLVRDLAGHPRAAQAAAALGLPLRTLQRRLANAGVSFSELLAQVRLREAASCLANDAATLAEIGFLCGYADQAHFTREFTRLAGMPPARYRSAAGPC